MKTKIFPKNVHAINSPVKPHQRLPRKSHKVYVE